MSMTFREVFNTALGILENSMILLYHILLVCVFFKPVFKSK